jgi:hypothetical protein
MNISHQEVTPMTTTTMPPASPAPKHFSLEMLRDEARQLVESGAVDCHQPIYVLCQFIPAREWVWVECELERNGFLLRDQIADLNPAQCWSDD